MITGFEFLINMFSVRRYNLMDSFSEVVSGFGNSVTVVEKFANKEEMKVTSNSLRSLCKTVLNNTNPSTNSALDRSKILVEILAKVCEDDLERHDTIENTEALFVYNLFLFPGKSKTVLLPSSMKLMRPIS